MGTSLRRHIGAYPASPIYSTLPTFGIEPTVVWKRREMLQNMEMKCYRKILCISYTGHVTVEEVRAKIQQAIGPHEDLLTMVKRRKLVMSPFIRSGRNHVARHSESGKKTRQTEEEVGRQHQGMDRPGVCQESEGSGEQGKMEETGCEIICGAPTILAAKG